MIELVNLMILLFFHGAEKFTSSFRRTEFENFLADEYVNADDVIVVLS